MPGNARRSRRAYSTNTYHHRGRAMVVIQGYRWPNPIPPLSYKTLQRARSLSNLQVNNGPKFSILTFVAWISTQTKLLRCPGVKNTMKLLGLEFLKSVSSVVQCPQKPKREWEAIQHRTLFDEQYHLYLHY